MAAAADAVGAGSGGVIAVGGAAAVRRAGAGARGDLVAHLASSCGVAVAETAAAAESAN